MVGASTLVAQSASTAYMFGKDIFLYAMARKRDIQHLEQRMSKLISHLILIKSQKEIIDRSLGNSPSMEPTQAYSVMEAEIAVIERKCTNLIEMYTIKTNNHLSSAAAALNADAASSMIEKLGDLETKVATRNFLKLAKLSRDVSKLSARASEAVEGLKPEKMTQKKSAPNREKLEDDGHVLPVFDTYVDDIMQYLFEDKGKRVGIFGCQGAGKTTVMKKLYDRVLEQKSSMPDAYSIIRIPETEAYNIEALQKEIMIQLRIHHEASESLVNNEEAISAFLGNREYIVLMDGVSSFVDLEGLGLKRGHPLGKVVVCSTEKNLLFQMTEHEVEIRGLDQHDALKLFRSIYGDFHDDDIERVAIRMIECCAGIPWMIREIATILRGEKDKESWYHAMRILQSEIKSDGNGFLQLHEFDKVYRISYERLEKNTKKCLLYGALFPHQHKIYSDYLIECWIAEGFISENSPQKVRLSRGVGKNILDRLTEKDLLRWNSGKKYVIMPPHFRRVALELGYSDEEGCSVWVPSIDRTPDLASWTGATRMSLIGCSIKELPQIPECSKLETLFLQSLKLELEQLDDSFFSRMPSLRLLDLKDTGIGSLPKSINVLVNLKSLYLNGCSRLVALTPEVAELQKLEFLDFRGTSVPTLPEEIKCLVNMRCLRASLSPSVEIIPEGVIDKLVNLEELIIDAAFGFQGGIAVAERVAIEMASLEHLNTLCFNFPNVTILNTFVTHSKALKNKQTSWSTNTFRSFRISVGCHDRQRRSLEPESAETWLRYSTNEPFSDSCQELLNQASTFEIVGHDGLNSFTCSKFDLHPVKIFVVESCKDLSNIMDGYIISEGQGFSKLSLLQNLETLQLYNLESLKCIWNGPVPPTTLAYLTTITINGCPELTKILDPSLAISLQSLEYLKVENCCQISTIIQGSDGLTSTSEIVQEPRSDADVLKRLKKMELWDLPELISICEISPMRWSSLKSIIVTRCNKLRNLSLLPTNCRKLQSIQCEESWWNTLTPEEAQMQHFLLRLCRFKNASSEGGGASSSGRSDFRAEYDHNASGDDLQASKATEGGGQINGNGHEIGTGRACETIQ